MAKFSAQTQAISALDYDFTEWISKDDNPSLKLAGRIPEPSDKQMEEFSETARALSDTTDEDGNELSDSELAEAIDFSQMQDQMAEAVAKLCSHSPSKDVLLRLPFRVRQLFVSWLLKQVQDPESSSDATKPSQGRKSVAR